MPSASELRAAAVERVRPSVVRIETSGGNGTGFVYKTANGGSEAYVVTAAHVVESQYQARVTTHDRFTVDAVILGADETSDIAVLKACCASFEAGSFGDVDRLKVGEEVMGLGYALSYEGAATLTTGIASWIGRIDSGDHWVQTDAPLNPGNSGGPLFSQHGAVMGIVLASPYDAEGIAFAVSEKTVRELIPHLENVPPRRKPTPTPTPVPNRTGKWSTWPELKAKYPEETEPYVHLSGTGSFPSLYRYSTQIICRKPSNRLEILFTEHTKEPAFYYRLEVLETRTRTVIDGWDFSTDFWEVQNNDEKERTNYWAPDALAKRIVNVLASGASELEFIRNPGTDYEGWYTFDVRGSREALKPVVAACR